MFFLKKLSLFMLFLFYAQLSWASVLPELLNQKTLEKRSQVQEFSFLIQEANKLGVKVYLFGGTAAAFAHYVRWDLERQEGDSKYQPEKFDYDFTNIYRGNQDLDIVIDGSPTQAEQLQKILIGRYPHLVGERSAWEIRLLRESHGDKSALLGDPEFTNQHTDTNSTGLISLNVNEEMIFHDLLDWNNSSSQFLKDVSEGRITYLFNSQHETTKRSKEDLNPPILSAIRYLAKLTQYEILGKSADLKVVTKIIEETDFESLSQYAKRKAEEFGLKTLLNAPDVEMAWDLLESTGLREKLILMGGGRKSVVKEHSLAWWMSKEPLRSVKIGSGKGKTARELFKSEEIIVSHETGSFHAYENITRSAQGRANVFISRKKVVGEHALLGDGFYTSLGHKGPIGTGITIRFRLHPEAKEGTDFSWNKKYNYILIHNKNALELIQENINMGIFDLFQLMAQQEFSDTNKGFIEKVRRKLSREKLSTFELKKILDIIENLESDFEKYKHIYSIWIHLKEAADYPHIIDKMIKDPKSHELLAEELMKYDWAQRPEWVNEFALHRKDIKSKKVKVKMSETTLYSLIRNKVFERTFQKNNVKPSQEFVTWYLGAHRHRDSLKEKLAEELFKFDLTSLQEKISDEFGIPVYLEVLSILLRIHLLAFGDLSSSEKRVIRRGFNFYFTRLASRINTGPHGLRSVDLEDFAPLSEAIADFMSQNSSVKDEKALLQVLEDMAKNFDRFKYVSRTSLYGSLFALVLSVTIVPTLGTNLGLGILMGSVFGNFNHLFNILPERIRKTSYKNMSLMVRDQMNEKGGDSFICSALLH